MFTQFGATADTLTKASTMVFRIGTDAHLYDDPDDVDIPSLLDSKFDSEKCEALKRLLALIAQGLDVSNFFPQVVKNVASQSLEVKKLAYLYLLHYAEKRPNEALLSINCFQKDLADINPLVRACALRTMAGIRLHVIAPIVLVAVGKCARDPSVYVRKCAANALPKLNDLRLEENVLAIEEIIVLLLNDNSPGVVGAAAAAFNSICPNNLYIIGRNFRRLCEVLPDVEEWGQILLIGALLRYLVARHGLVEDSVMCSLHGTASIDSESEAINVGSTPKNIGEMIDDISKNDLLKLISMSYIESPDEYLSRLSYKTGIYHGLNSASFTSAESNEDVKILLKSTLPLLWSQNSAVVLAAAGVQWIMSPRDNLQKIVKPLLFLLRSSSASKYIVLCNIQVFAKAMPALFAAYYEDFFLSASDLYQVKALKLEILSSIATESSITHIFEEFRDYIRDPDRRLAADTVAAIGLCAERLPQVANVCVEGLLSVIRQEILTTETGALDGEARVLIQAVMSLEVIIKHEPQSYEKVIIQLARSLDLIKVPVARATIIWMVGEYSSLGERFVQAAVLVLKYLARCFTSEAFETKLQILSTSAKVALHAKEDLLIVKQVAGFLLEIAKHDLNYDVRDRARVLKGLITSFWGSDDNESRYTTVSRESACFIIERILGSKSTCKYNELVSDRFYLPGSLSQLVLHSAPGYEPLPKPCSLLQNYNVQSFDDAQETALSENSYESDNATSRSSPNEESMTDYSSQQSSGDSGSVDDGNDTDSETGEDDNLVPLIHLSDAGGDDNRKQSEKVVSKRALETWLGDKDPSELTSSERNLVQGAVRISISDLASRVKVKSYTLQDTVSGNGLRVDYSFSSESSDLSPHLVCLEVSFRNCSSEPFTEVILKDEESDKVSDSTKQDSKASDSSVPILVPMEEIEHLEPGQTITRIIQVHFVHHLLPLKLLLWCSGKNFPVKLRPDIGYFVKPLPLDIEAFRRKESQLPGMFEYTRRCTFTDHISGLSKDKSDSCSSTKDVYLAICESLAVKMLSNANLHLVTMEMPVANKLDDACGLCLRFSCEIISSCVPCLITTTVEEGSCSEALDLAVKVNCEETVFGLNLMNRIVNFLAEQASPTALDL